MQRTIDPPGKPRPPRFLFASDVLVKTKKEHPEATANEINAIIAKAWLDLDQQTKDKYQLQADKEKEQYPKILAFYNNKANFNDNEKRGEYVKMLMDYHKRINLIENEDSSQIKQLYEFISKTWTIEDTNERYEFDFQDNSQNIYSKIVVDLHQKFLDEQKAFCSELAQPKLDFLITLMKNVTNGQIEMVDKESPEIIRTATGFYLRNNEGGFVLFHEK